VKLKTFATKVSGKLRRCVHRLMLRQRYGALAPIDKIVRVPISDVAYRIEDRPFLARGTPGTVVSGYPDLETFAHFLIRDKKYSSVIERFARGVPWRETELFRVQYAEWLRRKGTVRGCRTLAELERLYHERYDTLYEEIRRNGIDWQRFGRGVRPLYVHISEHGTFIWPSEGNHRFAICSVLGHVSLPCRVYSRHRTWQERREQMLADLLAGRPVESRLRTHPDMQDILEMVEPVQPVAALGRDRLAA
jgi:hypothetical protein